MFDQILQLVKEHVGNDSQVNSAVPAEQKDAVYNEIATHLSGGLKNHEALQGGAGGLLSMLQNAVASGNPLTQAIEGGLISSLTSKFGLSPMATGAIAGALPGLLQKFAHKASDPNDKSISLDDITGSLTGKKGGLGDLFH